MNVGSCLFLGMDAQSQKIAKEAVQSLFSEAAVNTISSLDAALERAEAYDLELLAVANPDKTTLSRALAATDTSGLRRWAIVVFGEAPAGENVEVVRRGEKEVARVAHAFRSAVARHELLRENARLKGDLLTIAGRVTHDLRSPLGAIVHTGEMLKEILADADPSSEHGNRPQH